MNKLEKQLDEWQELSRLIESVSRTRGTEQRIYLDQYIEKKQIYQARYHESFNLKRKPE